jgi:PAS domain S-box-containing protein
MTISPSRLAEALLDTASDAIVAADKDGVIRFWNPGAERIFVTRRERRSGNLWMSSFQSS